VSGVCDGCTCEEEEEEEGKNCSNTTHMKVRRQNKTLYIGIYVYLLKPYT
jgi:hypothetical protein